MACCGLAVCAAWYPDGVSGASRSPLFSVFLLDIRMSAECNRERGSAVRYYCEGIPFPLNRPLRNSKLHVVFFASHGLVGGVDWWVL